MTVLYCHAKENASNRSLRSGGDQYSTGAGVFENRGNGLSIFWRMADSKSLTILHVSDLQFGRNHRFGQLASSEEPDALFDTVFQRLSDDMEVLEKDGLKPDLVVVSGDLAEWGLKSEFEDALTFLIRLTERAGVPRNRVVIVPGNHDINRKLCEGYFATCEGEGEKPVVPYWPKWRHYHSLFKQFYGESRGITFSEEEPWTLYEFEDLKVVVAALNSTIVESHRDGDHYGFVGEKQMRWFADHLASFSKHGWFRLGVVHHNVIRGAVDDEENLRDADELKRTVGQHLNLILHGHTHKDDLGWADSDVPIISTGSAALKACARPDDVGNQYQWVRVWANRFERWTRRFDIGQKRWIGDTRCSPAGDEWHFAKSVQFASVHEVFNTAVSVASSTKTEDRGVVHVDRPLDANSAKQRLRGLPRFRLRAEDQHRAVRRSEQKRLADILTNRRSVWLIADWGSGKEGFLAASLEHLGGPEALADVFRLQCGGAKDCEELLTEAETQLGLSFQEFFAAVAGVPAAVLVFDDLPPSIVSGSERERFEQKVRPVFDFCPALRLVFVARQEPLSTDPEEVVRLQPLDAPETRSYLSYHLHSRSGLDGEYDFERIHSWSGGLPMHLDRLLERRQFLALSEILEEEVEVLSGHLAEPLPESLRQTVAKLKETESSTSRLSFRLLKVLTVLRDGETFQSVRRFYEREPFLPRNVHELVNLALLEDVPISQTVAGLTLGYGRRVSKTSETPQLLRVPRQVRDHVNSLITDEERDEIIRTSTGLFFGPKWWLGKIRLRTALSNAYGHSAIAGPGNEHVVARHLLVKALEKRSKRQIERYAQLALSYCHKLLSADRFRDAMIAAGAIEALLKDTALDVYYVDAAHMYGRALRMAGHEEEAVDMFNAALDRGGSTIIDENRGHIMLDLAMTYSGLNRRDDALKTAREVLKLVHPESDDGFQAQSLVAELTLEGAARKARRIELEEGARKKEHEYAANNIALDLARTTPNPAESLKWLEKVIFSARDNYSLARAIIEKASVIGEHLRASALDDRDRRLLSAAYSYTYGQRMGPLHDRCHNVLWGMFRREGLWASVLRLFRFSSFLWRLRGSDDKENKFLHELDEVDLQSVQQSEGQGLRIEVLYLERRRQSCEIK